MLHVLVAFASSAHACFSADSQTERTPQELRSDPVRLSRLVVSTVETNRRKESHGAGTPLRYESRRPSSSRGRHFLPVLRLPKSPSSVVLRLQVVVVLLFFGRMETWAASQGRPSTLADGSLTTRVTKGHQLPEVDPRRGRLLANTKPWALHGYVIPFAPKKVKRP